MNRSDGPQFPEEYIKAKRRYYGEEGSFKELVRDLSAWKSAERAGTDTVEFYRKIFANRQTIAVIDDDSQFFRDMAKAWIATLADNDLLPEWENFVFSTFEVLCKGKSFPTKLKVQRTAQRCRAFWSLVLDGTAKKEHIYAEYMFNLAPARVERIIAKRIEQMGEPVWTRIFARCGLAWLDKDPGGRPKASKNYLH